VMFAYRPAEASSYDREDATVRACSSDVVCVDTWKDVKELPAEACLLRMYVCMYVCLYVCI
jgi:hypothetical protein